MTSFDVEVWGVRGSIPTPGPATAGYGGNTSCVALRSDRMREGQVVILDAGTGIRKLGHKLAARGSVDADLLISHTHWDHIQGLPFFGPLFAKGSSVRVWGARQGDVDLESILRRQMDPVVFPVPLDALDAHLEVNHVQNGAFELCGCEVATMRVRHPGHTLATKLVGEDGKPALAYVPDNELGPGGDYDVPSGWRQDFVEFLDGVSLLIHDAMYTPETIGDLRGWGHSTFEDAVKLAGEANVGKLMLFHHSPDHDDDAIDKLLERAREVAVGIGSDLEIVAGSEGMKLNI